MEKLTQLRLTCQHRGLLIPVQRANALGGDGSIIATWEHCQLELFLMVNGDDLVVVDCTQENT